MEAAIKASVASANPGRPPRGQLLGRFTLGPDSRPMVAVATMYRALHDVEVIRSRDIRVAATWAAGATIMHMKRHKAERAVRLDNPIDRALGVLSQLFP